MALFVYRTINFKQLYELVVGAGVTSALVMFIIATAKVFGWGLAFYQIPEAVAGTLLGMAGGNTFLIYLTISIILLIAGMFMETASALIILTPLFLPAIVQAGGNLIHFGLMITVGLAIGMATPPVAIDIYVASAITGLSLEEISRPIVPMVLVLIFVFLLTVYVPDIVLVLPRLVWGASSI